MFLAEYKAAFNAKAILTPAEKMQVNTIKETLAYTRTVARNSMIDMKPQNPAGIAKRDRALKRFGLSAGESSRPGQAAFSKVGHIKRHIYFAVDARTKEGVAGPAKLHGVQSKNAIETLEKGGVEQIFIGGRKRRVSVTANYRARPTMRLAFAKAVEKKLPKLIENGIMREV